MGVGLGSLASVGTAILIVWLLLLYGNIPPELMNPQAVTLIRNIPALEMQFLFILGGDPINWSNPLLHGILLNFQEFFLLNILVWGGAGLVGGLVSRGIFQGAGAGLSAGILAVIISWILYWVIFFGLDVNALINTSSLVLLRTWLIEGLKGGGAGLVGGLIGGAITRKRQ